MYDKESSWMANRCGKITASELNDLCSASGKIIDTNLAYIRKKRWERERGFALPVNAKQFDIGHETEPYIYDWVLKNLPLQTESKLLYAQNLPELPLWIPEDVPYFGASPDSFTEDESVVVEFKTLVGNDARCFFMDKGTSYEEKKLAVVKEHLSQILGQFLSNPKVETIYLVKYAPQLDDVMADLDSPDAPWRGIVFRFDRKDYVESINEMKARIGLINAMIDSGINPSKFKEGAWYLDNGKLKQSLPEEKPKAKK